MAQKRAWMAGTGPAMTVGGNGNFHSFRGLRDRILTLEIDHGERGADALGGAVLEADHGIDRNVALAAIDGIDDAGVFLVDDAAAHFSRPGQLAVVGIELLIEQKKS